jgi:hypothetical protein
MDTLSGSKPSKYTFLTCREFVIRDKFFLKLINKPYEKLDLFPAGFEYRM